MQDNEFDGFGSMGAGNEAVRAIQNIVIFLPSIPSVHRQGSFNCVANLCVHDAVLSMQLTHASVPLQESRVVANATYAGIDL